MVKRKERYGGLYNALRVCEQEKKVDGATAEMSLVLLVHNMRKCLNKALFSAFST
jgi:hypothetical protein